MGAWAEDTFGNDSACDWAGDFLENPGLETVQEAIDAVLGTDDYLDSYSESLDAWIEANPTTVPKGLKVAANAAIDRILGPDSELPELWDEGGRNEAWHNAIEDLRQRGVG
jgi:hypothetical protein